MVGQWRLLKPNLVSVHGSQSGRPPMLDIVEGSHESFPMGKYCGVGVK